MLLALFDIAAHPWQLFCGRQVQLRVIEKFDAHAGHAVFKTLNVTLPAHPVEDGAGERCCFVHTRLFSFLTPPVKSPDGPSVSHVPQAHQARSTPSKWPV